MTCYRYLPYTLTLNSPAIASALGGDPNSSSTLPFIPGAAIRGAVARVLGDPGADPARQEEFRDIILGGNVRYLNAYPSLAGSRFVPVPVSFRVEKNVAYDGQIRVIDLAAFHGNTTSDEQSDEHWPEEQLKPLQLGFLSVGAAEPVLMQPKIGARIHNQRDRERGRAWKELKDGREIAHGAIFVFESLAAGQCFEGVIQICAPTDEQVAQTESRIKSLLDGTILIGRSRRGGYGGTATIEFRDAHDREVQGSGRVGLRPVNQNIRPGDCFRLLLTSACIARNTNTGQIDPGGLPESIELRLDGRAKVVRKRWSFEPVGGFNRKWRLELPQVLAVAAGSLFLLEAHQDIPLSDLHAIEHEGLGERKEEGYGRILFLDKPLRSINLSKATETTPPVSADDGRAPALVSEIEARIVWSQAMRKIEEQAASIAGSFKKLPSNSLIGRLRTPLRGRPEEAISTLKRWLRDGNGQERLKHPAREQLEECRGEDNMNLAAWILDVAERNKLLSELKADVLAQHFHIVDEGSAKRVLEERWQEAVVRLIDAVLATLAVRNKTQDKGGRE